MTGGLSSSVVEAGALARLPDYLQAAWPMTEYEETIVTSAYLTAFRAGSQWSVQTIARLMELDQTRCLGMLRDVDKA